MSGHVPEKSTPLPVFLTVQDMAKWLKKSTRSVMRAVQRGHLPKPFIVGGRSRWNQDEVMAFMKNKRGEV